MGITNGNSVPLIPISTKRMGIRWQRNTRNLIRNIQPLIILLFLGSTFVMSIFLLFDLQLDTAALHNECSDDGNMVEIVVKDNGTHIHNRPKNFFIKQRPTVFKQTDNFSDLVEYLGTKNSRFPASHEFVFISESVEYYNPTLAQMKHKVIHKNATNLEKFQWSISRNYIYDDKSRVIDGLLHDLATLPIIGAEEKKGGTEIKITLEFPNNIFGLFKPMRFPRDHQTDENHHHFQDFERHHSEIAAYHLDKALGFRRAVPVVGRKLHIINDVKAVVDEKLHRTFFTSLANNTCFYGNCRQYCDIFHPVCGNPVWLEGSIAAYIPQFRAGKRVSITNPWKRSYSLNRKAIWEDDPKYCHKVVARPDYSEGRRLLDVIDLSIFDFLMGNADRHSYNLFEIFGNFSAPILYDNGRGFGRAFYDDYLILKPLTQCCVIRQTTVRKLIQFQNGSKKLSQIMTESMANDPLSPVLWSQHLVALDRRVEIVLHEIRRCILSKDSEESFSN